MYKTSYGMLIKAMENDDTRELIGPLDIDTIEQKSVESLYYTFPLIERMVLEIYKLLPLSNVEYYQQGIMRTVLDIIKNDKNNYFPDYLVSLIDKYFREDGLRNKLFHVKDDIGKITVERIVDVLNDIQYMVMQLLSIMRNTYSMYTIDNIGTIELL